jgi:hypothetical protein
MTEDGLSPDLIRVLDAAVAITGDPAAALSWLMFTPIDAFKGKTGVQLVDDGRAEDLIAYLQSIGSGFVG